MSAPARLAHLAVAVTLALPHGAVAQKPPATDDSFRRDPYTQNEPEALARAGYVRYHPIPWAERHDSARIEEALGIVEIRWIETAHFCLGSALPEWSLPPAKEVRRRVQGELERLAERIPTVKPAVKKLDPWLRAHLYAQRLEELYAAFQALLGVTDASFPQPGAPAQDPPMGRGPYLGVRSKFGVLLFEKEADCGRYLSTFTQAPPNSPSRWYFADPHDGFVFATATSYSKGAFHDDTALFAHVTFNLAHNMIDAYRGYSYQVPVWWSEGLAHSLRRQVSTEYNNFTQVADQTERIFAIEDWERRVFGRVKFDLARPLRELAPMFDCRDVKFTDHLELWSRIEWLRATRPEALQRFVHLQKGRVDARGRAMPPDVLLRVQAESLREVFGFDDFDAFDAQWQEWVKKEYRNAK
jgi:hypothetical protein